MAFSLYVLRCRIQGLTHSDAFAAAATVLHILYSAKVLSLPENFAPARHVSQVTRSEPMNSAIERT